MLLQLVEIRRKFTAIGFYIRSRHKKTADLLTREIQRVAAREAADLGLQEITDVMKVVLECVERGYGRRALAWAGQDPAHRRAALQRGERPGEGVCVEHVQLVAILLAVASTEDEELVADERR